MAFRCPICSKPVEEPKDGDAALHSSFPFCGERCKLIDLGRWLDGKYQVPVVEDDLDEAAGPNDSTQET